MAEGADYRAAGDAVNINIDVREWPLHPSVCSSVGMHGKTLPQQYSIEKPLGGGRRAYELAIEALRSKPLARFTKARRRCRNSYKSRV